VEVGIEATMRIRSGRQGIRRTVTALLSVAVMLAACAAPDDGPDSRGASTSADPAAWDLVLLGDSVWLQAKPLLERRLEEELGVDIVVHDWINPDLESDQVGGERSGDLLVRLRTDEKLRQDLRDAEIIGFDVPTGVLLDYCTSDPATAPRAETKACFDKGVAIYQQDAPAIIDELVALRSPEDAIIRATTVWQFYTPTFRAAGKYDLVRPRWRELNRAVLDSAERHGITVLPAYDTFSGPDGSRDPVAEGDVQPDELHLTTYQGAERFVDLFVASGLTPAGE
jgi:hypothetical protein